MTDFSLIGTPSSPDSILASYRIGINDALRDFFVDLPQMLDFDLSPESLDVVHKLSEYSLRPGKRIRGSMGAVAYDYAARKAGLSEAGLALGVALELVQSYLLIVDDVMDRSDLRRGQPTIHQQYTRGGDKYSDMHEANMLAINVGLIAQHFANLVILHSPEDPARIRQALMKLHLNITATGFGQVDDLYQMVGRKVAMRDVVRKYRLKSSYYTFINPLQTGFALAGFSDDSLFRTIVLFGGAAGIAFQIYDDFLGVFGEVADTGKLNIDDLKEGKYTMLVQYALEHAPASQAKELRHILGSSDVAEADLIKARGIFERSGAKDFVLREAHRYADIAMSHLDNSNGWDASFRLFLAYLVQYSVSRHA